MLKLIKNEKQGFISYNMNLIVYKIWLTRKGYTLFIDETVFYAQPYNEHQQAWADTQNT